MDGTSLNELFLALSEEDQQAVVDRFRMYISKSDMFEYNDLETSAKVWEESVLRYVEEKEE